MHMLIQGTSKVPQASLAGRDQPAAVVRKQCKTHVLLRDIPQQLLLVVCGSVGVRSFISDKRWWATAIDATSRGAFIAWFAAC